jgi:endo-1,4-beta-xylanase
MNRREMLALSMGLTGLAMSRSWIRSTGLVSAALSADPNSSPSLRDVASAQGVVFGAAVPKEQLIANRYFAGIAAQQCGILVPEVELKWKALRPAPDQYDFSGADWLLNFAQAHQMLFRGHTLVWEQALPNWFGRIVTAENAEKMMMDHIATVVRRYAGRMHSWDVVNEAFQIEDGRPDGLKNTGWLRFIGADYIENAFHAAHQADPNATLVYNENWLEPEDAATDKKRKAVLALLTRLKKNNVPVHALGIQSHLFADTNACNESYKRFLHEISDLGLGIMITEMDVREKNVPAEIGIRDRIIASQYYKYLSFMLQFPAVKTVITWGLSDRYTWITTHDPRPDGIPVRPLPYDAEMNPKPAWDAIRDALQEARRR